MKTAFDMDIGLDYKIEEKMSVNLNYLDYPILIKYHLKNGIELSGGVLLSFMLSDNIVTQTTEVYERYDSLGNITKITSNITDKTYYNKKVDDKNPNNLLSGFQIGISYTIKRFDLRLLLNKNTSFGNIQNISNNKNITFQFQLGYILKKNRSSKKQHKIDTI